MIISAHQHDANAVARSRSRAGDSGNGHYRGRRVVIRIGRSRVSAASDNGCQLVSSLLEMIGKTHDQDAVLRNQATRVIKPTWLYM